MGEPYIDLNKRTDPFPTHYVCHLAKQIFHFSTEEVFKQLIEDHTKSQLVGDSVKGSLLDLIYSYHEEEVLGVFKDVVGRSDYLGIRCCVLTKTKLPKNQSIKKRLYKNFDMMAFLCSIDSAKINEQVMGEPYLSKDAQKCQDFSPLDKNVPVKTIQLKRNYNPFIITATKALIKSRNVAMNVVKTSDNPVDPIRVRQLAALVRQVVRSDRVEGAKAHFGQAADSRQVCRTAKRVLGMNQEKGPTNVLEEEGTLTSNPLKMATLFNKYFVEKVSKLRKGSQIKIRGDHLSQ